MLERLGYYPREEVAEFLEVDLVDNTADVDKPVSAPQQTAIDLKLDITGYTAADVLSKLLTVDGPGTGLNADLLDGLDSTAFAAAGSGVLSFNTRTGAVTLLLADVTGALGYTPTSVTGLTGTQSVAAFKTGLSLAKGDVGLGNVDNTSDANKPVSTAQQTALDLKLNSASYTAADVLAKLLTVDGAGSGLDADLLDGNSSAAFALASHVHSAADITSGTLAVLRGGTGVTTSTGSGNNVLSASPTLTGTLAAAAADFSGAVTAGDSVTISGTSANLILKDTNSTGTSITTVLRMRGSDDVDVFTIARASGASTAVFNGTGIYTFGISGVVEMTIGSTAVTFAVMPKLPSYTVATVPAVQTGGMIYVSNETGGAVPAFSDGTNWRRVTDRAVVA